jgi:hypothetical protein
VAVGVRGRDTVVVPAPVAECVGEKPPEGEALSPAGVAVVLREAVGARDELGEAEAIETVPVVEAETEGEGAQERPATPSEFVVPGVSSCAYPELEQEVVVYPDGVCEQSRQQKVDQR